MFTFGNYNVKLYGLRDDGSVNEKTFEDLEVGKATNNKPISHLFLLVSACLGLFIMFNVLYSV